MHKDQIQNITERELRTAFTAERNEAQAVSELYQQLFSSDLGFVLFFCSTEYDLEILAAELKRQFDDLLVVGCTTAGEITVEGYAQGCISAIGFSKSSFAASGRLITHLEQFKFGDAQGLVQQMSEQCLEQQIAPIKDHSFALTLFDGLSIQEEQVLVTLDSALGSIPHFGGSAGDDVCFANTHVYIDGKFHTDAAVIILINTSCEFRVFSRHHMQSLDTKLVVTEADSESRRVLELNAEPAALEYARVVGVKPEELNHEIFALNPVAVRIGEDYFVRSIQSVNDDMSLTFYCAVENGIVLTHMAPGKVVSQLDQQLEYEESQLSEHLVTLGCDCFLRRLEANLKGLNDELSDLLQAHKVVGFNTYGEQIDGMHINQTFTGVAIGRER